MEKRRTAASPARSNWAIFKVRIIAQRLALQIESDKRKTSLGASTHAQRGSI